MGNRDRRLQVLSPADAAARYGDTAAFVITIWGARGPDRMKDRVNALRSLGCATVIPFGPLSWRYPDGVLPHYGVDLPHKTLEQSAAVLSAFDLWADEESKGEYIAQLQWRLSFDFDGMAPPKVETI